MTTACALSLGIALALYLAAALLFQGQFLLRKKNWDAPGRKLGQHTVKRGLGEEVPMQSDALTRESLGNQGHHLWA